MEEFLNDIKKIENYIKTGEPHGCGNWHCSRGCKLEYEGVPNPHVYRSFDLFFERQETGEWKWGIEGTGLYATSTDPIELLHRAAEFPELRNEQK